MQDRQVEQPELSPHTAQPVRLQELEADGRGDRLLHGNLDLIRDLRVRLQVQVGGVEMSVGDLFALHENAVLALDRMSHDPLDLLLDGKTVARGHLVVVDDSFGIRISEISPLPQP